MKLLVIFHIYYHNQVDWFVDRMRSINGCSWDLKVTFSQEDDATIDKIRNLKPDAEFIKVGNNGYDVLPFINVLKNTDLAPYDCIMKLHTKNIDKASSIKLNGIRLSGEMWRDFLVNSMLKSQKQFTKCLKRFENNGTGMVCCEELHVALTRRRPEDMSLLEKETTRIGFHTKRGRFCAGTMFMVRPACLEKVISADFSNSEWCSGASHIKGTLAHVYERILSIAVIDAGYRCDTIAAYKSNIPRVFIHKRISPALKQIFTFDRYGEDARKCLVIFGCRIMLE